MMNGGSSHHVPSPASSASGSGSGSSKHVRCIGRYVITGNNLGKGNFARVEAAVHTLTRSKVAIKIIETDKIREEYVRKNLLREAQLMRRLRHPNIIRLYETMKTSNLYCLVMEVAEGGELLSHVRNDFKEKRLSEATTRPFIRQLVSALYHLHSAGIVHRDLKMENIMLDRKKRQIKIVDFGLSNAQAPGSLLQTHCGSPEYAAPELFIPGREYGPEVDVWSLGVNMYAMLVGKLPFRSPRQGSKKRQKLLEQIQAGLTESREKDISHVTPEGRDLIGKLLQPNSEERIKLTEVMQHSWITKDGAHPLYPYKYTPPDQATQKSVMQLMSSFLEVSQSEIKEAVRRDRCDWMAAIYNLLIDQPDGRVVMQRLLSAGPEEQLVDAAHYQQGAMEHFRLSQDLQPETTPDVAQALTASVAGGTHSRAGHRHSIAGDPGSSYPSSTLPLTRQEKRRHHHQQEPHPPAHPLGPVQPPPPMRRMSIGGPQIVPTYPIDKHLPPPSGRGGRKLPPTPSETPYHRPHQDSTHQHHHHSNRPHSRAESEPNPLPLPWRASLVQKSQLSSRDENEGAPHMKPLHYSQPPPPSSRHHTFTETSSNHGNPTQLISPLSQMGGVSSSTKNLKRNKPSYGERLLRPVRPISTSGGLNKRISASVDTNLDMRGGEQDYATPPLVAAARLRGGEGGGGHRGQVGPRNHGDQAHTQPHVGWGGNYRLVGSLPRRSRDIQALMQVHQPITSPYSSVQDMSVIGGLGGGGGGGGGKGSATSVDIKSELFSDGRGRGERNGGEAWGHGSTGVSPYGSRAGSGYGNRRVSPHGSTGASPYGSTGVSPYGSTTVSPYGSRTVSPHGSRAVSPRQSAIISPIPDLAHGGPKVISPNHSRVIGRPPVENIGEIPKSKRRHHRSISANPATKGQSSDYYTTQVNGYDAPGIPNGAHRDHHHGYEKPPHHLLPVSLDDPSEVKRSLSGKHRNHTHPGEREQYTEGSSHLTEL